MKRISYPSKESAKNANNTNPNSVAKVITKTVTEIMEMTKIIDLILLGTVNMEGIITKSVGSIKARWYNFLGFSFNIYRFRGINTKKIIDTDFVYFYIFQITFYHK
jgi:hypothetical protein